MALEGYAQNTHIDTLAFRRIHMPGSPETNLSAAELHKYPVRHLLKLSDGGTAYVFIGAIPRAIRRGSSHASLGRFDDELSRGFSNGLSEPADAMMSLMGCCQWLLGAIGRGFDGVSRMIGDGEVSLRHWRKIGI